MNKLKALSHKKDKGIALIFSLFFLVIFFAVGTALLFRANINKKTSNALTNTQLSSSNIEGAIGEVRANLTMANLNIDGSNKSSGTSLAFEGKMQESTLSNDRSAVYTLSSTSPDSNNGNSHNIVSRTTPELFKFNFNGEDLDGIDTGLSGAPEPEWVIHYSDDDKTEGTGAVRYSYLIIDQTGKINPNFGASSVYDSSLDSRQGFDTEIFKRASAPGSTTASSIYDLSGLFTTIDSRDEAAAAFTINRFDSVNQVSEIVENGPPSKLGSFQTADSIGVLDESDNEITFSSQRLAHETFYPFSFPVTYEAKKLENDGTDNRVFNLAHLDSTKFKDYSDEQKIEEIVGETESDPEESNSGETDPSKAGIPYLAHMPSEEFDPNDINKIPAQKEQIAASLIDMVDDDLFSTNNYGIYESGDPYDTDNDGVISSGETVPNDLIGKPWSWLTWLEKTGNRPYSGFEGLYINQFAFHFDEFIPALNLPDDGTGTLYPKVNDSNDAYHNDGFEKTRLQVRAEMGCAYDLNGTTLTSIVTKTNPEYIDSNKRLRLLIYARYRVSAKYWEQQDRTDPLSPWTKPYRNQLAGSDDFDNNPFDKAGQPGLVYGANETTITNYTFEAVGYAPTLQILGRPEYKRTTGKNGRSNRSYTLRYVPEKDYNTFEQRDGKGATSDTSEHWDNWSGCFTAYYRTNSLGADKNDIGRLGMINYEAAYQPMVTHVAVTLDSPVIIFIDREDGGRSFDNIPQADEIVSITTPNIPQQLDDNHKGFSGVAYDRAKAGSFTDFPQGLSDLATTESYKDNLVIAGRATNGNNRRILTTILTGDPRLGHIPSSTLNLKDIETINNTTGAGGDIETAGESPWIFSGDAERFSHNQIEQIHLELDHFKVWSKDDLNQTYQAPYVDSFRFPTKEELMFTFPKTDNEVVLNKNIVDHNSSPKSGYTDLSALVKAALDIDSYQPNREIGTPEKVDDPSAYDGSGFKSISSFALPLRYTGAYDKKNRPIIDSFGGLDQVADIGKICRGEHWRTLNLCQYNVPLVEDPSNTSLYSYAGVKAPNYIGEKDANGSYRSDYGFDSSKTTDHPIAGSVEMLYPYNRYDIPDSETVDDLITDYQEGSKVGGILQGGDAAILDQVSFDDTKPDEPKIELDQKTIYGAYNPNTTYPLSFQSFISGIKINRSLFATRSYRKGEVDAPENPALPTWKSAALTTNFYQNIKKNLADSSNEAAPFDRKYAYSDTLGNSPGDASYTEGFNISNTYDPITRSYMNGKLRTGSFRWGNVFANDKNYFLVDSEREALYTNTREFISIRYNYYSAIILVESLKIVPKAASGNQVVEINSSGDKAKIESHYRVRAELAHDILTNEVKVMSYSILN